MRGHFYKRNNKWYGRVELPPDPKTGKRRQKRITAPTKKAAEALAAEMIAAVEGGRFAEAEITKMTVEEYVKQWLPVNKQEVRPSTHRRYDDMLRLHALPHIGKMQLAKLTPLHLQDLYADRQNAGKRSGTTVFPLHNIIHKMLKQAIKWGLLTRNVSEAVSPPKKAVPIYTTWSQQEALAFLKVADQDEFAALWRLALMTGMRRGESLGLTWASLDMLRGVLAVHQTIIRGADGSKFEIGRPKTNAGKRSIILPKSGIERLKVHYIQQIDVRRRLAMSTRTTGWCSPRRTAHLSTRTAWCCASIGLSVRREYRG